MFTRTNKKRSLMSFGSRKTLMWLKNYLTERFYRIIDRQNLVIELRLFGVTDM